MAFECETPAYVQGRPQLSSRIRIRTSELFWIRKWKECSHFLYHWKRSQRSEERRWVTVVGTEDWAAKCPTALQKNDGCQSSILHLQPWELLSPHTFHWSLSLAHTLASVSGLQWKLKERARSCLGVVVWNRIRAAVAKWPQLNSGA